MSFETDETFKDEDIGYYFKPYYPCLEGLPANSPSYVGRREYKRVKSYRGKRQFVNVGRKRRKVFHPFNRYTYSAGKPIPGSVCKSFGNYNYIGWVSEFPFHDIMYVQGAVDPYDASIKSYWSGDLMPIGSYALSVIGDELRQHVIRDMYVKLNSPRFSVAVFLAELDETLVGIKDLLLGAWKELLRGRGETSNILKLLRNPQEVWLWYRYALTPAMLEVESIMEIFAEKQNELVDRVQDGSRSDKPELHTGTLELLGYGSGHTDIQIEWTSDVKYGVGGAIDVISRHDPAKWGTSAQDVLLGTWNRIPWSFVIDWFINVNDWLTSLRSVEVVIAQSYATYAVDATTTIISAEPYVLHGTPKYHGFHMDRIVDVERPTLPLVDKRWRNILRSIDAISLIIGTFKSAMQRRK